MYACKINADANKLPLNHIIYQVFSQVNIWGGKGHFLKQTLFLKGCLSVAFAASVRRGWSRESWPLPALPLDVQNEQAFYELKESVNFFFHRLFFAFSLLWQPQANLGSQWAVLTMLSWGSAPSGASGTSLCRFVRVYSSSTTQLLVKEEPMRRTKCCCKKWLLQFQITWEIKKAEDELHCAPSPLSDYSHLSCLLLNITTSFAWYTKLYDY